VDESGIGEHFYRQRARSAVGKKVFGFIHGKKFCRTNIVAGYVNGKTMAECVYDGTMNGQFFNAWVEQFSIHALRPGQIVARDNAAFHKLQRTRDAIGAAGCSLHFLPPYSPDFNPIEKFWANFKRKLADLIPSSHSLFAAISCTFAK
jgi:transposase